MFDRMLQTAHSTNMPERLGIVTAPTGAAIRDIMNIAARRNPYVQLMLYPALVQGEQGERQHCKRDSDAGCLWVWTF